MIFPGLSYRQMYRKFTNVVLGVLVHLTPLTFFSRILRSEEGGVRVCGDAVLHYFWCSFAVIFILTRGIAVSKH